MSNVYRDLISTLTHCYNLSTININTRNSLRITIGTLLSLLLFYRCKAPSFIYTHTHTHTHNEAAKAANEYTHV